MKVTKAILGTLFTLSFALAQIGCNQPTETAPGHDHSTHAGEHAVKVAVAELQPTEGHQASGTVTFTQVDEGIRVVAELTGLEGAPGKRGFHIHENGDCSAPDATSAGGHFNPEEMPHGAPDDAQRHAGDFGNLTVDAEGNARADFVDTHISFEGPHSIIGRAVIVHAAPDDLESQPSGDAGPRAGCGVIQIAEYEE